jgi:hypothetical protein
MELVKGGEVGVVLIDGQKAPERRNMKGRFKKGTRLNGSSKVLQYCNSMKGLLYGSLKFIRTTALPFLLK